MTNSQAVVTIKIDDLIAFDKNPFRLYDGQRFADMLESVKFSGVLVPIIVRKHRLEGKYEILSGHNRTAAAKMAEIERLDAVVYENLSDDEAMFIVTESNLIQRSFADLKHSERAAALTSHYNVIKLKSGYRTDLIEGVSGLLGNPVGTGSRTRNKVSAHYGLGTTTVVRYLRIHRLISALMERLDNGELGLRVAEALSYLKSNEQEIVAAFLNEGNRIVIRQADTLKLKSREGDLDADYIRRVLNPGYFPPRVRPVVFGEEFLSRFFDENSNDDEIKSVIEKALEQYFGG